MGPLSAQNKWTKRFTQLTEYDKKRHDGVKAFVDALRRLEEKGILKHCGKYTQQLIIIYAGSDKQGAQQYLIYGFRYPRSGDDATGEKGIIKNDIFDVFNYVSATYVNSISIESVIQE